MDSFDEKHKMIQKLLGMLKNHAVSEVDNGLKHPEGEGDMHGIQAERVEVLPGHGMDEPTPEHDVITHEMSKGGSIENVNDGDYKDAPAREIPYESADGQPDKEGAAHKEVGEGMEKRDTLTTTEHEEPLDTKYEDVKEEPSSMFASFLGRKRKK